MGGNDKILILPVNGGVLVSVSVHCGAVKVLANGNAVVQGADPQIIQFRVPVIVV